MAYKVTDLPFTVYEIARFYGMVASKREFNKLSDIAKAGLKEIILSKDPSAKRNVLTCAGVGDMCYLPNIGWRVL